MFSFKSPSGQYYTRQLFWEQWVELEKTKKAIEPIFTLYKDKPDLINFGRVYAELEDPTGYKISQKLLNNDYRLWTLLMNCKWFVSAKKLWDEELDARLASQGMEKIKELLVNGLPAQQLAAAKYLANKEHRKDNKNTKGRPSNAQIAEEVRKEATYQTQLNEDYERIRLVKR